MEVRFDELNKKIKMREDRANEILVSLRAFAVPDDNLTFVVDPEHAEKVSPFLAEIKELRAANRNAKLAMQQARQVYADLVSKGLVSGDSGDPIRDIDQAINSLRRRHGQALEELRQLQVINPETIKPDVLPEKRAQAYKLTDEIRVIPKQLGELKKALEDAEEPFKNLTNPPAPQRGYGKLPSHEVNTSRDRGKEVM